MPVSNKEKCICQICICGEHRCEASKATEIIESVSKTEAKTLTEKTEIIKTYSEQNTSSSEQIEKTRKQWETSPDQMKEISRSLSNLNGYNSDKKDQQLVRSKRSAKDKPIDNQTNRPTLPPIHTFSDSDSGKELTDTCICEGMYKSNGDLRAMNNSSESNQWIVTRPIRNKPKDNLRLEGPMEMETTFKTSYESTAKKINESHSKNVAVVVPSTQLSTDEINSERLRLKPKTIPLNVIKASKKKSKHRPSTSLKAGGDGYFNTINKESYKNFVIIDDKPVYSANGKKQSVCCSTVSQIKLPKVDSNNREEQQITRKQNREEKLIQIEQINRSMQRLTTDDKHENKNITQKNTLVDSSVQTSDLNPTAGLQNGIHLKPSEDSTKEKTSAYLRQKDESQHRLAHDLEETHVSWTVGNLEEPKRFYTRDVDSIKELHLLDEPNEHIVRQIQRINETDRQTKDKDLTQKFESKSRQPSNRIRIESKNYVQPQRIQKKHKNESSMKFFEGNMDFTTTTRAYYPDKSPNRNDMYTKSLERERTAGKRTRKSGRRRNLFRTSTEAEFGVPYGQRTTETTTYQKQFGDRLYCPAIDLGSNQSDFKYKGEASGHQFFLPAVNN